MKQNSIFSYVERNNNNSKGVDRNEQCSSNLKDAPNVIQLPNLENGTTHI